MPEIFKCFWVQAHSKTDKALNPDNERRQMSSWRV